MISRTMTIKQILFLLTGVTLFASCSSGSAPEISVLCLRDDIGNYVIKWETDPYIGGSMKLYVSDSPENFNMASPVVYANINDGVATYITNDNISRKYFLLSFNDKYFQPVGPRSVATDSIQNLRDIGGYPAGQDDKITRWGKVFRSGELEALSYRDTMRLVNLGIKTVLDLRSEDEVAIAPRRYVSANTISIPIRIRNRDIVTQRIEQGRMRKGDALLYMQDTYLRYVNEDNEQFAKALKVFLNKNNYPILVNCSMGKDRVGFLTAMLLSALGVPEETVRKDYMSSSEYFDINHLATIASGLSTESQEAITVLVSTNESFLDIAFQQIKKEYGSTDKFLQKGLHLTEKERDTLKDIMLY